MNRPRRILALAIGAALTAGSIAHADKIFQTDGKVLEDVKIQSETILDVTYKEGNNTKTIASDKVLRVEFLRMPKELEEAEAALVGDDMLTALDLYDEYSDGQIRNRGSEKRFKWAPPYAAWRCVELRIEAADLDGIVVRTELLIQNYPDSRYVSFAFLAKASAELQSGKGAKATSTLETFSRMISANALSKRWELECRLAQIRADPGLSGEDKREKLADIIGEAGRTYPIVKSRASVAEGETYLVEADATRDQKKAKELRGKAKEAFEEIIADPRADEEALAGAYTGLGECVYYLGLEANDAALLKQASMYYLRVAVLYESQSLYVPKALFYAMRCFDLMEDRTRKMDMKRTLKTLYPSSVWTARADKL